MTNSLLHQGSCKRPELVGRRPGHVVCSAPPQGRGDCPTAARFCKQFIYLAPEEDTVLVDGILFTCELLCERAALRDPQSGAAAFPAAGAFGAASAASANVPSWRYLDARSAPRCRPSTCSERRPSDRSCATASGRWRSSACSEACLSILGPARRRHFRGSQVAPRGEIGQLGGGMEQAHTLA
jgi:hypothetical protein